MIGSIRERSHLSIAVYNARGEHVVRLYDGEAGPGPGQVVWGGRDGRGGELSSGVYFYQLEARGASIERKMVLLK